MSGADVKGAEHALSRTGLLIVVAAALHATSPCFGFIVRVAVAFWLSKT